jgi:hypothetical protein
MTETTTAATGTPNLNKALSLLQGEMPKVTKTKTGKIEGENKAGKYFSYEYSYADLGDVVADMGPLMAKHGLAFHCAPTIDPANRSQMILAWSLLHESGEERNGEWPLGPVNQKPQSLGSAITYGRRYSFTAATNIVLEDDDDGQRAQQDHTGRQSAGDVFDNAAPAAARQNGSNGNGNWARWLEGAVTLAPKHTTLDTCRAAWKRSAELIADGKLTQAEVTPLRALLTKRMEELKATGGKAPGLAPDDPWRDTVEGLSDVIEAETVLADAETQMRDGTIDAARFEQIEAAVKARFPDAAKLNPVPA